MIFATNKKDFLFALSLMAIVSGCSPGQEGGSDLFTRNLIEATQPGISRTLKGDANQIRVVSRDFFQPSNSNSDSNSDSSSSLIIGLPKKTFIGHPMILGATITEVSSHDSSDLGNLKLTSIPPLPMMLKKGPHSVSVLACEGRCNASSAKTPAFEIPILKEDPEETGLMYLDFANLGGDLDLTFAYQNRFQFLRFESMGSKVARVDYSDSTLVFDVVTQVRQIDRRRADAPQMFTFTNRWFLKPERNAFHKDFIGREPTEGVGFFLVEGEGEEPQIAHWDLDSRKPEEPIHYYIKNVPTAYHKAFAAGFDDWNTELLPVLGRKVFSYEFIPEGDPRNAAIISGDIRYNVLEWDLLNKAPYGGLGPSQANRFTGEIIQANVLIQGPTIIQIYTKWYQDQKDAEHLRERGQIAKAEAQVVRANQVLRAEGQPDRALYRVKLGPLEMKVNSHEEALYDPASSRDIFDLIPEGIEFDEYMSGYFRDMVAHELGHNLGLRHNFKGNLGAQKGTPTVGKVSRSIMEYLGRGYRYLDRIGPYDIMAISYGYRGTPPDQTDWYCSDESVANLGNPKNSAECSRDDATADPFGYFRTRLGRVLDLLTAKGQATAPEFKVEDLHEPLQKTLTGLGAYAISAPKTASTWTNFFNHPDRPSGFDQVKDYVLTQIKLRLCEPSLDDEVTRKDTEAAKKAVEENLEHVRKEAQEFLGPVFTESELECRAQAQPILD